MIALAFENHRRNDFKPYLLRSTNAGRSWTSIAANLPVRGSVYAIAGPAIWRLTPQR